jgi:hypothetical protein
MLLDLVLALLVKGMASSDPVEPGLVRLLRFDDNPGTSEELQEVLASMMAVPNMPPPVLEAIRLVQAPS